jgi:hypothetical protein
VAKQTRQILSVSIRPVKRLRRANPRVRFHPIGNGNRPNVASPANEINNGPVLFALFPHPLKIAVSSEAPTEWAILISNVGVGVS